MSIKLTKMYTIRYIQGPTITSRRVSGISSTWTWTSESGGAWVLAIDEFSRHEAGELVVGNRHGRWIRNLSKITLHFTAVRLHVRKNRKSVRHFPIFTALSCTPCISSVQFLYHLPVIKKLRPFSSERGLHRLSKHHVLIPLSPTTKKGQLVQQIDFARVSMRMNP